MVGVGPLSAGGLAVGWVVVGAGRVVWVGAGVVTGGPDDRGVLVAVGADPEELVDTVDGGVAGEAVVTDGVAGGTAGGWGRLVEVEEDRGGGAGGVVRVG